MQATRAITILKQLRDEARDMIDHYPDEDRLLLLRSKTEATLTKALGSKDPRVQEFQRNNYDSSPVSPGTTKEEWDALCWSGLSRDVAIIDAAIFVLEEIETSNSVIDVNAFDPDLWTHVMDHVQSENWQTVASQAAIFVEHTVRQWCGDPKGKDGKSLVGKGLFLKVLSDNGDYKLGKEISEWEGWRDLGGRICTRTRQRRSPQHSRP